MATATTEFVNSRVVPIEQSLQILTERFNNKMKSMTDAQNEAKDQLASRDADLAAAEKRFEEIAKSVSRVEEEVAARLGNPFDDGPDDKGRRAKVMQNPAFRSLDPYAGDHSKFNKFRSKLLARCAIPHDVFHLVVYF